MKKKSLIKIISLILVVLFVFTACAGDKNKDTNSESTDPAEFSETETGKKADGKLKIGFTNWSRSFEFYVDLEKGIKEVADELGIELITSDADGDLAEQTKQLENFIAQGVDGIIMIPIDSDASGDGVVMVNKANIPIITVDIGITSSGETLSHIESNNYMGGQIVAEYIGENLKGKGKVAVIDNPTITSLIDRRKGFTDVLEEKYPDIEIVEIQSGDSDREKGMKVAENILLKYTDLDYIFAVNDQMGLGALQVVETKNLDTKIIGFSASDEALQEINKGSNYVGTLSQEPKIMGATSMKTMMSILNGDESYEKLVKVDVKLITKDNISEYVK